MAISSVQSGYSLMQQSQSLANQAARDIAERSADRGYDRFEQKQQEERLTDKRAEEEQSAQRNTADSGATANDTRSDQGMNFNRLNTDPNEPHTRAKELTQSHVDSLLQLNQAKTYNQVGANVVQRSNDIVGTMLDTHV